MRLGTDSKATAIAKVPLFSKCSKRELKLIAQLADEIDLPVGKELTQEGARGREFFVLVEGTADVRRKGRKVNAMSAGDFFGEIALVSNRPRTATVTATSPLRVLVVTDRAFRELMRKMPSIQSKVLAVLAERCPTDD